MTQRPEYNVGDVTIEGVHGEGEPESGFRGEWDDHNTWRGSGVVEPTFVEVEEPETGTSSRSLPPDHRTRPVVYVYSESSLEQEYYDVMWNSKDYGAPVRMEVVVTEPMDGRSGKDMRDAVINVLQNVQEANAAPAESRGVFGSRWRSLKTVDVDRTPTRFSSGWRAYYDIEYEALGVI